MMWYAKKDGFSADVNLCHSPLGTTMPPATAAASM